MCIDIVLCIGIVLCVDIIVLCIDILVCRHSRVCIDIAVLCRHSSLVDIKTLFYGETCDYTRSIGVSVGRCLLFVC